ncbi:MAG: hypothetical protein P8188_13415 [Gemmatimonadota bacterium]
MVRGFRLWVAAILAVGCSDAPVTRPQTQIVLQVVGSQEVLTPIEQATVRLEGPGGANRTLVAGPGETLRIEGLTPGLWRVAVEGLTGTGAVSWFDEIEVTLESGAVTERTLTARPFQPADPRVEWQGDTVLLTWTAVAGATEYRGEALLPPAQTVVAEATTSGTSLELGPLDPGAYLFRVRAVNRFGNDGEPALLEPGEPPTGAGTVRVRVITAGLQEDVPLPDIEVSIDVDGSVRSRSTGSDGVATFTDLPVGAYVVAVGSPGPGLDFPQEDREVTVVDGEVAEVSFQADRTEVSVERIVRTERRGLLADVPPDVFPRAGSYPARIEGVNVDLIESVAVSPSSFPDVAVEIVARTLDALEVEVSSRPVPAEATTYGLRFPNPLVPTPAPGLTIDVVPFRPEAVEMEVVNGLTYLERGVMNTVDLASLWITAGQRTEYQVTGRTVNPSFGFDQGQEITLVESGFQQDVQLRLQHEPDGNDRFYWVQFVAGVDGGPSDGGADLYIPVGDAELPTVTRYEPASIYSFLPGEPVTFRLQAVDPQEGILGDDQVYWFSSEDGYLGTGRTVERLQGLSPGQHTLFIRVEDSDDNVVDIQWKVVVSETCPGRCYHELPPR